MKSQQITEIDQNKIDLRIGTVTYTKMLRN